MALIVMAVYDTVENNRSWMTERTLESLSETVDLSRHRVIVVDNASIAQTHKTYTLYPQFSYFFSGENLGTAAAVNVGIAQRRPGECVVKIDNDVVIENAGWCDLLEQCISANPQIGIIGLKRNDLLESPDRPEGDPFKSYLHNLELASGEVVTIEEVNHCIGTCQMFSPALLDKIGFLYQPRLYGFDDSIAAVRCKKAGFKSYFLPHIVIHHIDPGGTPFQDWKHKVAMEDMPEYNRLKAGYQNGTIPIYYNPFQ